MINYSFIDDVIKQRCKETGGVCPYWVDDHIMKDLLELDRKDDIVKDRADRYWNQCHSPHLIYQPMNHNLMIVCRHNNPRLGEWLTGRCKYQNPELCEKLKKGLGEFGITYQAFDEGNER